MSMPIAKQVRELVFILLVFAAPGYSSRVLRRISRMTFALNAPVKIGHCPKSICTRGSPGVLQLRASMRDYRKSMVEDKASRLEKFSRKMFDLQDCLLQLSSHKKAMETQIQNTAPEAPEPKPKSCAVVGTGPAGLATAIMLARYR
jgi:hypothetical protein